MHFTFVKLNLKLGRAVFLCVCAYDCMRDLFKTQVYLIAQRLYTDTQEGFCELAALDDTVY